MSETVDQELRTPCGRTFRRGDSSEDHSRLFGRIDMKACYRGRRFMKFPLDIIIYMRLLHQSAPATVIEIGSFEGGSALWFADMISIGNRRKSARVVSVDVKPPTGLRHPKVSFLQGSATALGEVLTEELLATLPRPWLVTEDSAHIYDTTKATLDFFGPRMRSGEYIVIEDGAVGETAPGSEFYARFDNGPNRAVVDFLTANPAFEVDAELCDHHGYNMTGNPNGYLRCK